MATHLVSISIYLLDLFIINYIILFAAPRRRKHTDGFEVDTLSSNCTNH